MPPTSVNIFEEGAEIVSLKIVDGGMFDKKGLYEYMVDKPAQYPGSSGCRNIKDVESDLKAVGHSKVLLSEFVSHSYFEANCGQPQGSSANHSTSVILTIYLPLH
jgi:N-methylhydantoinase B/oxoprolinase/acetone carboxylase alpha subunit